MKDKIIANFKAKFPAVTLSTKRMDEISDRLSKKITNEDEIDAKLDEMNELLPFADIQKSDDKIRDLNSKLKTATATKDTDPTTQSGSTTTQGGKDTPDDTPAWAKRLIESNQQLSQKLAALEKEKTLSNMQSKLATHEKLKGISPVFYKGRALPEKEEDLEAFVDGIKTDFDAFKQESNNDVLTNGTKPAGGTSNQTGKVSPMFAEVMAAKKAEAAQQNK
jgi:hypothetical protein